MNKKILIVRGNRQNAKALSFLLAGSGYQISAHHTAGEAVEAARHQRFDLAITDEALPENQPDLSLVSNLKQAQPALPILYIAQEQNLETVISCIRAGVTEVLDNPNDLKQVIETTNSMFRSPNTDVTDEDVTWEDILEVERMLESTSLNTDGQSSSTVNSAEIQQIEEKLQEALNERDRIAGELASSMQSLEKSRRLVDELKNESGNSTTDSEIAERSAELDERERRLKEMSGKLSQQKFEVESQLAELEAQQIEFEEAQKDAGATAGADISNEQLDQERAEFAAQRLEMQATIQDLQRKVEVLKANASGTESLQEELRALREKLQDATEQISEKDFIIEQRDRELNDLKSQTADIADNPKVEELEDEKRLVEIERHKLQERIDQLELEKRLFEESHEKNQREILVERRDAEVSLRELQNTIKEEQLKLKVDQATLKEDMRQFEHARTNFQEDVQDLQSKQAELRKLEAYLNQMERSIKDHGKMAENTLPKPDSSALEPLETSSATTPEVGLAPNPASPAPAEQEKKPESWGKPNMEKKAGRGPLRIGRRSSF
ncbi:response regulator [Pelagicoccus mobilis]|uniref:Response regulator n=1 Tax=Pelagicoccus mobilis TaxID=415221 RepID=A0A934S5A3_9BACT|nr:response regulator [Pelagicoccus mobilis]MBK1879654.1 response regulator [Pelagicoccus mobilis]